MIRKSIVSGWIIISCMTTSHAFATEACASLDPHLLAIEAGAGQKPTAETSLNLGETSCSYKQDTTSEFDHAFVCSWDNTETKIWTTDDAKDIGRQLHQQCWQLSAHIDGERSEKNDYFLWFGDFTGITVNQTGSGIELIVQIDEEAYYFS